MLVIIDGLSRILQGCSSFNGFHSERHSLPLVFKEVEAFDVLKELMTMTLILQLADPNLDYIVTCDANNFAVGAVLSQIYEDGEHPIAFESRNMNLAEGNYSPHER